MEIKKLNRDIIKERFNIEFTDDGYRLAFMTTMKRVYGDDSVAASLVLEEVLVKWDNFVTNLRDGYQMSVYELDNDMDSYLGSIEHMISSKELKTFQEHKN